MLDNLCNSKIDSTSIYNSNIPVFIVKLVTVAIKNMSIIFYRSIKCLLKKCRGAVNYERKMFMKEVPRGDGTGVLLGNVGT
jgi:hypothetical protein